MCHAYRSCTGQGGCYGRYERSRWHVEAVQGSCLCAGMQSLAFLYEPLSQSWINGG